MQEDQSDDTSAQKELPRAPEKDVILFNPVFAFKHRWWSVSGQRMRDLLRPEMENGILSSDDLEVCAEMFTLSKSRLMLGGIASLALFAMFFRASQRISRPTTRRVSYAANALNSTITFGVMVSSSMMNKVVGDARRINEPTAVANAMVDVTKRASLSPLGEMGPVWFVLRGRTPGFISYGVNIPETVRQIYSESGDYSPFQSSPNISMTAAGENPQSTEPQPIERPPSRSTDSSATPLLESSPTDSRWKEIRARSATAKKSNSWETIRESRERASQSQSPQDSSRRLASVDDMAAEQAKFDAMLEAERNIKE